MENMCSNCGFYKTPPLFWGGSTEPSLCDCPKERSYSEEEVYNLMDKREHYWVKYKNYYLQSYIPFDEWFEQFKKK